MGNTCFANCILQCLAHAPPLIDYFHDAETVENSINATNPLGYRGDIAREVIHILILFSCVILF